MPTPANVTGAPANVTFDAPLQQTVTLGSPSADANPVSPANVTFDAPTSQAITVAVPQANQPSAQTQQATGFPNVMVSATPGSMPGDSLSDKIKNWSDNVTADLLNGTDITGVGSLLKKMGAHGLSMGVSPGIANFMGSLPLGLLKATKGSAELTQPGQKWQGTKDTVGGLLDASTIPAGFASPLTGELAGQAGDAALTQAENAAKSIKAPFSAKAVQPKIQGAITSAIQQAAQDHGIALPSTANIRDVTQALSDAVRAKAHGIYQQLDTALGGTRFQTWDDQLQNITRAIRDSLGIEPDKDAALAQRLNDVTTARNAAMDQIRAKGLDPDDLIGQADKLHQTSMALGDVSKAVRASTDVHPSLATTATNGADATAAPANVKTAPLFKRMQALATPNPKYPGTPSRLVQALGEQRAAELLNAVDTAHLYAQKVAARNAVIGKVAKVAGYVGLGGAGAEAVHLAHSLLGSQ